MTGHLKYLFSCALITTGLYSMDSQKELHNEIDIVHTCDLDAIRSSVSSEQLKQHAPQYFDAAMHCNNTRAILEIYNAAINRKNNQTFAHYVNKHYANHHVRSLTGSHFLDMLIEDGKLK